MLTIEKIKDLVFDTLGDFVDPETDVRVEQARDGSFRVIVIRTRGIPKEVIRDEWHHATDGTEFENVSLYM